VHHPAHEAVAEALGRRLERVVEPILRGDWRRLLRRLGTGDIALGTLCTPYVVADRARLEPRWEVLGALVPRGAAGLPRYSSSLVVRAESSLSEVEDLRGRRLGYNEPFSLSGYHSVRLWLAGRGEARDFFAEIVETGGHRASLRALHAGHVDVIALDSTVEAWHHRYRPEVVQELRRVATLGPHPHPPLVVHRGVDEVVRTRLREAMASLAEDPELGKALEALDFEGLAPLREDDLEELARALHEARGVRLAPSRRDLRLGPV
jgi:ABC-type phosphate/phosphonate transport system substrate-binding protein